MKEDIDEHLLNHASQLINSLLLCGGQICEIRQAHTDNRGVFISTLQRGSEHAERKFFPNGSIEAFRLMPNGNIDFRLQTGERMEIVPHMSIREFSERSLARA